jgi:eukaryotic-like serine/threonine-protein kinase
VLTFGYAVSTPRVSPVRPLSSTPQASEEQRAFLQERAALFARASGLLAGAFYLALNATATLNPRAVARDWYCASYSVVLLAIAALSGATWLALRRWPRSARMLKAGEAAFVLALCFLMALILLGSPSVQRPELSVINGLDLILVLRAVFMPSTAGRTAAIGCLAILPAVACAYVLHLHETPEPFLLPPVMYASVVLIWGLLGVTTATLTSRVIYGLRKTAMAALRLGQYTLEKKIGEGGMGVVFLARHALLRRPTAIKLLHAATSGTLGQLRFEREVQLTSGLSHPSTVAIYDYGHTPNGVFYYAMEYIDGVTLEELGLRYGPQPPGRVIHILRQMCGALHEAHQKGLIHRDVKPANAILCERGEVGDIVKVLDFGLAKELGARSPQGLDEGGELNGVRSPGETQAGVVSGTPQYMAPEAIRSPAEVDARTDLYALGCVGYFLLTGTEVFPGSSVTDVCSHHLVDAPEPPSERLRDIAPESMTAPNDLERAILQCLEKEPARRPPDARAFAEVLAACASAGDWTEGKSREWWKAHRASPRARAPLTDGAGFAPTLAVEIGSRSRDATPSV